MRKMLSYRRKNFLEFSHQLNCFSNSKSTPCVIGSLSFNHACSSSNSQYCQIISARRLHCVSNTQSYLFTKQDRDLESISFKKHIHHCQRSYSSLKIIHGYPRYRLSISPTSFRNIAAPAALSALPTIVPTVAAENHSSTLHEHITTTAVTAGDVASNTDSYGWLTGYISFLESVAASAPVLQLMSMLRVAHETTGLPWWLTIVLTTVVVRTTITLPLAFYQQYVVARLELLRDEMMELMKELAAETRQAKQKNNWDEYTANLFFKRQSRNTWNSLVVRDNCHPGKGIVMVLAQLPLWILLSISHRNLALGQPLRDEVAFTAYKQLSVEGLVWCPDLTVTDPMLLLPVVMGLVNLIITEVHGLQRPAATTPGMKRLTYFLRGVSVITVPIAMFMPSGVVLYWVTSSCCALSQTLLMLHPGLRKAVGIPDTPSSHPHPYRRLAATLTERLSRKQGIASLPVKTSAEERTVSNDKDLGRLKKQR